MTIPDIKGRDIIPTPKHELLPRTTEITNRVEEINHMMFELETERHDLLVEYTELANRGVAKWLQRDRPS